MPAISKIRLTNVVYEDGDKRFNDEVFLFNGHNGAILLENGGGKTVFIHTVLQAILPHTNLGNRKIKETLQLENAPAHIGIEWIINEQPRRYMTTAVSLFLYNNKLDSHRYVYEYEEGNNDALAEMPFAIEMNGSKRPAYKEEIVEYYSAMKSKTHLARTFDTITAFHAYIEEQYKIITNEWESIVKINRDEGGIEKFFENCRTTTDLYDRLLIPTVEDSIAGHEAGMFADMFEKQREGFQTYRNLQKSMEEHAAIATELEKYVGQFAVFSERQAAYETAKQKAKGLAEVIQEERTTTDKMRMENERAWEEWQTAERNYDIQVASFDILREEEKARTLQADHLEKLKIYDEIGERLRKNKRLFYSLQYAKLKQDLETYEQSLAQHKAELKKHDAEGEAADYEAQLEIEHAKLHGYFQSQLEQLEKTIEQLEIEQRPMKEMIEKLTEQAAKQQTAHEEATRDFHLTVGQITTKNDQLAKIKQQILANPAQEDVATELDKWSERHQWLDEEIIRLQQFKKDSEQKTNALDEEKSAKQEAINQLQMEIHGKQRDEEALQKAHDKVIEQLAHIRPSWQGIDNLYLKENNVYGSLIDLQAKYRREREEIMYEERLARRFVDDYDEQQLFFSDPFLADKLTDWQNQFYVETGTSFYADINEAERKKFLSYPLWALTLITTEADKAKLLTKLTEIKTRLQYPISVLTLEEVKQIGSEMFTETWIAPEHWRANLTSENFTTWKEEINEAAQNLTSLREEKEREVEQCNTIIREFEQFFEQYPASYKEKLMEEIRSFELKIEAEKRERSKLVTALEQLKREIKAADESIKAYSDEKDGLARRMEKAQEFNQVAREVQELTKASKQIEATITAYEKEMRQLNREIDRYEVEKQMLGERIAENNEEIRMIKADANYEVVKDFRPQYTDEAKAVIIDRRQALQLKIYGIRETYGEIVAKYEQAKKDIARTEANMTEMKQSYDEIDLEMSFPADGERVLARARTDVKIGETEREKHEKIVRAAKEAVVSQTTRVETKIEQFEKEFSDASLFVFDLELRDIAPYLTEEKQKLTERKTYLQGEKDRIDKQLNEIIEADQQLDRFAEAHHFKRTNVTATLLTEKEQNAFTYERSKFVTTITNVLRETSAALEAAHETIERAKRHFRTFCRDHITERKLREMATTGIDMKTTYEDVLEFRQNMLTTLDRADQYARNYISEQDKEVQAFINSIHNHLLNVTEQLRIIPRKTKVKVGEKWKEIFKFTIPEWTEEDGKSRIRTHLDWILEQLEASFFKDEQGLEDSGKVRKHVETWLQTKSLLQVVMDNKGMKVSCRKVTNDNQVTSRLTSWEQSNQWSGGEKWSKNMTLFLGILNFVAEKKQHLTKNLKRHRAVILDNPFGKASSDHVLSPVFFIAEQLGFQIIALTAHADGKFLQDYFPIIYSLKLRASQDEAKQVMTKEKSLHHAYFEDHEPAEMERLEEREQLELF